MAKSVIVIASGETERRAVPHLLSHIASLGVECVDVVIPPGHKSLSVEMAERLIKASWFSRLHRPVEKFVILVDIDGKDPQEVLRPFEERLPERLGPSCRASLQFAFAQQHLEAWFFADNKGLRTYLGRDLGSVDTSNPDEIQNPKLHLENLLARRIYTAVVSEELSQKVDTTVISQKSPSFRRFLDKVQNGSGGEQLPSA